MEEGEKRLRILIAEDDETSRAALSAQLVKFGHQVVATRNGEEALQEMNKPTAPALVILDWVMPGTDGIAVCRAIRGRPDCSYVYILLLTAKKIQDEDIVFGFDAGADDFVTKPVPEEELRARIQAGVRIIDLHRTVTEHVRELQQALSQVRQLQGLLPICSYCKKIRNDQNYWQQVEGYIQERTSAQFTHSFCPDCYDKHVLPMLSDVRSRKKVV